MHTVRRRDRDGDADVAHGQFADPVRGGDAGRAHARGGLGHDLREDAFRHGAIGVIPHAADAAPFVLIADGTQEQEDRAVAGGADAGEHVLRPQRLVGDPGFHGSTTGDRGEERHLVAVRE